MSDAAVEYRNQPIRNWVGRAWFLAMSGEELVLADEPETGVAHLVTALDNAVMQGKISWPF